MTFEVVREETNVRGEEKPSPKIKRNYATPKGSHLDEKVVRDERVQFHSFTLVDFV